jgi:hypothetical protein
MPEAIIGCAMASTDGIDEVSDGLIGWIIRRSTRSMDTDDRAIRERRPFIYCTAY